jgi:nitrate reductase assembly molybdenum cofactor insertion protein NarJ
MTLHPMLPTTLAQFADVLDYPQPGLAGASRQCAQAVVGMALPNAANGSRQLPPEALLHAFASEVEPMSYGLQEEAYASTFDLGGAYPYVGYQLLGETYKRSVFMLELKNRYRAHGLNQDDELADHLVSILRYMRVLQDEEEFRELTQYAVLPALDKVLAASRMRDENDQSALPPSARPTSTARGALASPKTPSSTARSRPPARVSALGQLYHVRIRSTQ